MKEIREIEQLTAADLQRIGADKSIPVPEDLRVKLPQRKPVRVWSAAAAIALVIGLGWLGMNRQPEPKDSFDDPYLAYAAVEKALVRVSGSVNAAAGKVEQSEMIMDKVNYWK
ncbi:MAG: hypothetical protein J5669_07880 [Bacteroidales bacterium]|nr:hypothetical protein [Bacteroidales bacterium]